jgi:hypothetical protein
MNIDWSKAPEGATHYAGGTNPWHNKNTKSFYSEDHQCWIEYHNVKYFDQFLARATPRPTEQPAWSGKGFPPVGAEVEYCVADCEQWGKGKILVYGLRCVCVLKYHDNKPYSYCISEIDFRPIKTERDQQIDALSAILEHFPYCVTNNQIAAALYDKGVRVEK